MVKEEHKIKREDIEFPPWELVDYWLQTKEYFSTDRH